VDANPPDECAPADYSCVKTYLPQPGIPTTATFAACQRAADRRTYCLLNSFPSGNTIRQPVSRWTSNGSYEAMFDCSDPTLALDTKKANPCSTISATLGGDIWLAGRDGSTYSIIKVVDVKQGALCPMGFNGVRMTKLSNDLSPTTDLNPNFDYCMLRYATGIPVVVDMSVMDARVGKRFKALGIAAPAGPGLLLLEDRKTVAFLPDRHDNVGNPVPSVPVEIASGKTDFNLVGSESVQSEPDAGQLHCCGVRQLRPGHHLDRPPDGKRVDQPGSTSGSLVLGPSLNVSSNPACTSTTVTQQAWVRVSLQSGRIYLSDRCAGRVRGFEVPQTGYTTSSAWSPVVNLSTANPDASANPPNSLSVFTASRSTSRSASRRSASSRPTGPMRIRSAPTSST
jgi:hypothetical protein